METGLTKKAEIITLGTVSVPREFSIPVHTSRSTAGPDAGQEAIVLEFEGRRVRVTTTDGDSRLRLEKSGNGYNLMEADGRVFQSNVSLVPIFHHCPEGMAFFNVDPSCKNNCAFCNSSVCTSGDRTLTPDRVAQMLKTDYPSKIKSIAFTTGMSNNTDSDVDRLIEIINAAKEIVPTAKIGVEAYVDTEEQLVRLKDAGVNEMKINIQCATEEILGRVCPDLDFQHILDTLNMATEVFRKNKVSSNIIYGLGETDQDLDIAMGRLCHMGVLPNLRLVRINDDNRQRLIDAGVPMTPIQPMRPLFLAGLQKGAMKRHGLSCEKNLCMCFRCGCCDIVPFMDV